MDEKIDLLSKSVNALETCNELLKEKNQRLLEELSAQGEQCRKLQAEIDELSTSLLQHKDNAAQIERLQSQLQRAHEKAFNIAFTSSYVTKQIIGFVNSKSFNWTNFFRYSSASLMKGSLQAKADFFSRISKRLYNKQKMNLPSALSGIERELNILNAALDELCIEINPSAFSGRGKKGNTLSRSNSAPPAESVTQWRDIFNRTKTQSNTVMIATVLFYDADGQRYMYGGAERYIVELFGILTKLGMKVMVVQTGTTNWELSHPSPYGDIPVKGLASECKYEEFSEIFYTWQQNNPAALVIYSPFWLAYPCVADHALGISHGIFWDSVGFHSSPETAHHNQVSFREAFANCRNVVSVDANTINWFRTIYSDRETRFIRIPNFVDKTEFFPAPKDEKKDKIRIVYPRRLYGARGFDLVVRVMPEIFRDYPNVELHLIGQIDASVKNSLKKFLHDFPDRVTHRCCPSEEMPEVYRKADIVLIPTLHSEGTSLSCLEAMASRCAIIATNVGGLPELIVDHANGLLISPEAEDLLGALKALLDNPTLRKDLADRALQMSEAFSLAHWQKRWEDVLHHYLSPNTPRPIEFVQLAEPGMTWNVMKQRPQQLFQALAGLGYDSTYISAEETLQPDLIGEIPAQLQIHPMTFFPDLNDKYLYLYTPFLLYHCNYQYGDLIRKSNCKLIFDILDDPSIHTDPSTGRQNPLFAENFDLLLKNADFVITSANVLYDKYVKVRPDLLLVHNGVTIADFKRTETPPRPSDLPQDDRKIVGYYGALAQWVDFTLIEYAAKSCPDLHFVLIGLNADERALERLTALPNVSYLGLKHYSVLGDYLHYFDVATIPFKINPVTNAASPIKLFEYCAAGVPVVTTAFTEVLQYHERGVAVGKNHEDFVEKIRAAARLSATEKDALRQKLQGIAEDNTWEDRAQSIVRMLEKKHV